MYGVCAWACDWGMHYVCTRDEVIMRDELRLVIMKDELIRVNNMCMQRGDVIRVCMLRWIALFSRIKFS